jgi:small subunit ribosomal protein S3
MGQKANPIVLRLGIIRNWDSVWYADKDYAKFLYEDFKIRQFLKNELARAGLSRININRKTGMIEVNVYVARPGVIFGRGGIDSEMLNLEVSKLIKKDVRVNIHEEKNPEANSRLLCEWIAGQLEKRIPFRRAMKMSIQKALKAGAKGIRVACAGRLGGVEIARTEWYREGKVPLHTFRADIDYSFSEALTTYGKIGIKVWIYNGEILEKKDEIDDLEIEKVQEKAKV